MVLGLAMIASSTVVGAAHAASSSSLYLAFSESRGASRAIDSGGQHHNGSIGSHVVMGGGSALFDYHAPTAGVSYGGAHLVTVPDTSDSSLDPGSGNFTVELRYRTTHRFGNILQKGQNTTTGGQVKIENPNGIPTCLFKSPSGQAGASAGAALNDGTWHTLRCVRTPIKVSLYVDGVRRGSTSKPTGSINNSWPWSVGGKSSCNGTTVTCDYFAGSIDYVKLTKG